MDIERATTSFHSERATSAVTASAPTAAASGADPSGRSPPSLVEIDQATRLPVPLRYPWISRLAADLKGAATTPPPFEPAAIVGETVNQIA